MSKEGVENEVSCSYRGWSVSGLCATRHLLNQSLFPVVYEMTQGIGGTWAYDENVSAHSSMYQNLVINQPKQIMELPDHKFPDNHPTYFSHKLVLKYLKNYFQKFNLSECVKFGHKVEHVTPVPSGAGNCVRWKIDVLNLESREHFSKLFDCVLVCNGHYTQPRVPKILGDRYFKGEVLHSHSYRSPCQFAEKDVLILGAGASGVDIAIDVAGVANHVYISHKRSPLRSKLLDNINEVPDILSFNEDGRSVTLIDGRSILVDSIIYCTGYLYHFPFLDEACGILVENNRVTHLYKHIVNINHNSMLFIGIPALIPVGKTLSLQAQYAAALLAGKATLPSKEEMLLDEEQDFKERIQLGWPFYQAHNMTGRAFKYADYLSNAAGVESIPNNIKNLYTFILGHRPKNLCSYKKENYRLNEHDEFEIDT